MNFWKKFYNFFHHQKVLLLSDDVAGLNAGISVLRNTNLKLDVYDDYKEMFRKLYSRSHHYYIAFIFKNGSATKSESASQFLQYHTPSIKTIIFDSRSDLEKKMVDL